ncbi:Actin-related protein 4 [Nymphaea thermarum]|nr:Actin-related protein 4 [Nymphaea thermarum]
MESLADSLPSLRGLPQMVKLFPYFLIIYYYYFLYQHFNFCLLCSFLVSQVIESINKCDVDIRRDLFSTVLLSGGTASIQQLKERLEKDVGEEAPQAARVKVLASGNTTERRFSDSVWIGGSILASLGSFQQMWFSKAE